MDNPGMGNPSGIPFTKMHGAGNDFIVIDARAGLSPDALDPERLRAMADRRLGIGADQILLVEASPGPEADFVYRIFNADGHEVEQCGNGARCFARYVVDHGLAKGPVIRVKTKAGLIQPRVEASGDVTVDMGAPRWEATDLPFDVQGLPQRVEGGHPLYGLDDASGQCHWLSAVSMGNPHLVEWVADVAAFPVDQAGPWLESHPRLPRRVNAGYAQRVDEATIRLRVFERGAGETLSCGTGACAAVVSGMLHGQLKIGAAVSVSTRGGRLQVQWSGEPGASVFLTGPAANVFEGVWFS